MPSFLRTLKSISRATAANLIGRTANVLIGLSVITLFGANAQTDKYFFIMAVAFFFFGVMANAIATAVTPLLISEKINLTKKSIWLSGLAGTGALTLSALIWSLLIDPIPSNYILALGLMAGAGIANGCSTGCHNAAESFMLPGASWMLRLIPLVLFVVSGPPVEKLSWLAIGIGLADWLRCALLIRGPVPSAHKDGGGELTSLIRAFPTFGKVIAAAVIMGLNPIIDRLIAQLCGPGAVSILEAGERVYMMLASACTIGMSAVLLTRLSREAADDGLEANWPLTIRFTAIWNAFWIFLGIIAGYWGLAWWLKAFTPLPPGNVQTAQEVYWCYLIGLPAFAFGLAYVNRLQALQRWWILLGTAVLSVIVNIPASLVLRAWLGVPGIALATTLIYGINFLVLRYAARRGFAGAH